MKTQSRLYIAIDGVLLTAKDARATDHSEEFIDFIIIQYDRYWLTTH